jgi:hypothetical protein
VLLTRPLRFKCWQQPSGSRNLELARSVTVMALIENPSTVDLSVGPPQDRLTCPVSEEAEKVEQWNQVHERTLNSLASTSFDQNSVNALSLTSLPRSCLPSPPPVVANRVAKADPAGGRSDRLHTDRDPSTIGPSKVDSSTFGLPPPASLSSYCQSCLMALLSSG